MKLPSDESNTINDMIHIFKLLFDRVESNSLESHIILSKLRSVFSSKAVSTVFTYLCRHGACTAKTLQHELAMPEANAYRALKHLTSLGFVSPALKVSKVKRSRGGPRPSVWALDGTSPEEVAEALILHYQLEKEK